MGNLYIISYFKMLWKQPYFFCKRVNKTKNKHQSGYCLEISSPKLLHIEADWYECFVGTKKRMYFHSWVNTVWKAVHDRTRDWSMKWGNNSSKLVAEHFKEISFSSWEARWPQQIYVFLEGKVNGSQQA